MQKEPVMNVWKNIMDRIKIIDIYDCKIKEITRVIEKIFWFR